MVASDMKQLEAMLSKEIRKAVHTASEKMESDLYEEVYGFYTGGEPKVYKRTGALGDTPRTTAISQDGNTVSMDIYLDLKHRYTTGKHPTMYQVLNVANDHSYASRYILNPPVGSQGFWDRAEIKMKDTYNQTMRSFFHN